MLTEEFDHRFSPLLSGGNRWNSFQYIAYDLIANDRPVFIVETGCARQAENWLGDGQSTLIWDWIVGKVGGSVNSFDISEESVECARKLVKNSNIILQDSVTGLRSIGDPNIIDLLYLDSYDLTDGIESPTHHLAELASIYPYLRSGCLIAIDDCINERLGKHRFASQWLSSIGVNPVLSGYITVWRKP